MHNWRMEAEETATMIAGGESLTVEFKEDRRNKRLNDTAIVEAVVCLANAQGGSLFLGVSDDGRLTGLHHRHGDHTDPVRIDALILGSTIPPLVTSTDLLHVDEHEIAVVSVPKAASPVGTSGGKYLRRALDVHGYPQCNPYPLHEMFSAGLAAQDRDLAALPARDATIADLEPAEFDRFRTLCGKGGGDRVLAQMSNRELLHALRLLRPDGTTITLGAVLVFGTEIALCHHFPNHEVIFVELADDKIRYSETIRAPLIKAAERLAELIGLRNHEEELMTGMLRVGIPRIPPEVVRECIANALVHRDYVALGAVQVQIDETEFRVASPGGFPAGVTLANLLSVSIPRSPLLAEAFKRAGLVDRAGRGVRKMYAHLLRAGRGIPDYRRSDDRTVDVRVPTADIDLELVRFILEFEEQAGKTFQTDDLQVLYELKTGGPQSITELDTALGIGTTTLRPVLNRLNQMGIIDPRGAGRNRRYSLTASFYRLAQASEYIRMQDSDPIQQATMVSDYVRHYGSITRGRAAELCRITPQQASSLLQRLVRQGDLVMHGARRGARYELPG